MLLKYVFRYIFSSWSILGLWLAYLASLLSLAFRSIYTSLIVSIQALLHLRAASVKTLG